MILEEVIQRLETRIWHLECGGRQSNVEEEFVSLAKAKTIAQPHNDGWKPEGPTLARNPLSEISCLPNTD